MTLALYHKSRKRQAILVIAALLAVIGAVVGGTALQTGGSAKAASTPGTLTDGSPQNWTPSSAVSHISLLNDVGACDANNVGYIQATADSVDEQFNVNVAGLVAIGASDNITDIDIIICDEKIDESIGGPTNYKPYVVVNGSTTNGSTRSVGAVTSFAGNVDIPDIARSALTTLSVGVQRTNDKNAVRIYKIAVNVNYAGAGGTLPQAQQISVIDYSQCANGIGTAVTCTDGWINGILQSNNSHFVEGQVTAQRAVFSVPQDGPATGRTLRFEYQTRKGGIHAYDSLATWNYTVTGALECLGLVGTDCVGGAATTFQIPDDSTVVCDNGGAGSATSLHELPNANALMTMYGGTITNVQIINHHGGACTGDEDALIEVTYKVADAGTVPSGGKKVMLLFGGHLALGVGATGWGNLLGAGAVSGGPYHIKWMEADAAAIGNRDNQIQSSAIALPPAQGSITIIKDAQPNNAQDFAFTTTGTGLSNFSLDDDADATLSNTKVFTGLANGGYTVTESATAGWTPQSPIVCTGTAAVAQVAGVVTITLSDGHNTATCTFVNVQTLPNLTATKTHTNATLTAPGSWTWSIDVANSGNAVASFAATQKLLSDALPLGLTYGTPTVAQQPTGTGSSGAVTCANNAGTLECTANTGGAVLGASGGHFTVTIAVTGAAAATYNNGGPAGQPDGTCKADPTPLVTESNENDNNCQDSVTVTAPATRDLYVQKVTDTAVHPAASPFTVVVDQQTYNFSLLANGGVSVIFAHPITTAAINGLSSANETAMPDANWSFFGFAIVNSTPQGMAACPTDAASYASTINLPAGTTAIKLCVMNRYTAPPVHQTVKFVKIICANYGDVPRNEGSSGSDDVGAPDIQASKSVADLNQTAFPANDTDTTPIQLPANCHYWGDVAGETGDWQFQLLSADGNTVHATINLPAGAGASGINSTLSPVELALARQASALRVAEVYKSPWDFAAMKCWRDHKNSDNWEWLDFTSAADAASLDAGTALTGVNCVAYNVRLSDPTLQKAYVSFQTGEASWTVTIANTGANSVQRSVVVKDADSVGYTIASGTGCPPDSDPNTDLTVGITCTIGAGSTIVLTVKTNAEQFCQAHEVGNSADMTLGTQTITRTAIGTIPGNSSLCGQPELTKTPASPQIVGNTAFWNVTVTHTGTPNSGAPSYSIHITDNATFVGPPSGTASCDSNSGSNVDIICYLEPGESITIKVSKTFTATCEPQLISNTAEATGTVITDGGGDVLRDAGQSANVNGGTPIAGSPTPISTITIPGDPSLCKGSLKVIKNDTTGANGGQSGTVWGFTVNPGALANTITGTGNASFPNLTAGAYTVAETQAHQKSECPINGSTGYYTEYQVGNGAITAFTGAAAAVNVVASQEATVTFYNRACSISAAANLVVQKFEDPNGNMSGSTKLSGWVMSITGLSGAATGYTPPSQTTASSGVNQGQVVFAGLPAGTYKVCEAPQNSWNGIGSKLNGATPLLTVACRSDVVLTTVQTGGDTVVSFYNQKEPIIPRCLDSRDPGCTPPTQPPPPTSPPTQPTPPTAAPTQPPPPPIDTAAGARTPGPQPTPIAPSTGSGTAGAGTTNLFLAFAGLIALSAGAMLLTLNKKRSW